MLQLNVTTQLKCYTHPVSALARVAPPAEATQSPKETGSALCGAEGWLAYIEKSARLIP